MTTLAEIRKRLDKSQSEMAAALGLSLRAYQDVEKGGDPRPAYLLAAEYVALQEAWLSGNPMLASVKTRQMAVELSRSLVGV